MKDYLLQFRDQVFNGALSLYKRIFLPFLILQILVGILSALVFIPLCLKLVGWDFTDLMNLEETMKEFNNTIREGGDPSSIISQLITEFHFEYLIPVILIAVIFFPWTYNLYLTLNDNEVRHKNIQIMSALKLSFSSNVFKLLGFFFLYYLLCFAVMVIFFFMIVLLMQVSKALGILVGFISFFFVIFFLMRFILVPPAIVHGKMSISEAFGFSYTKLTMKRSALLFLMTIVVFIVMALIGMIGGLIMAALINRENADPTTYFWLNQMISQIVGTILNAFIFAAASAIYFRYSQDEILKDDSDHIYDSN